MQKNTAGKWAVFAWTTADGLPKTGDAAQITANMRIDGGAANAIDDTNPAELEDGYYLFDITAAEANGDNLLLCPASSTAGVQVIGVPGAVWTRPANFEKLSVDADGRVDVIKIAGTAQTAGDLKTLIDDVHDDLQNETVLIKGYIDTEVAAILAVAQKLDTALELDGAVYRFTVNALEQAPSGATVEQVTALLVAMGSLPQTSHVFTAGERIVVARGDKVDLPFALGPAHDCTGKKLFFCAKAKATDVTPVIDVECALSDALNVIGTVPLTPALLATILSGVYEYERRDADGTSNPHTVVQGAFQIAQDVRQ